MSTIWREDDPAPDSPAVQLIGQLEALIEGKKITLALSALVTTVHRVGTFAHEGDERVAAAHLAQIFRDLGRSYEH
jgi:hypothetical protein